MNKAKLTNVELSISVNDPTKIVGFFYRTNGLELHYMNHTQANRLHYRCKKMGWKVEHYFLSDGKTSLSHRP